MHTKHTTNTGTQLIIPVDDLQLEADDNALTLATQETYEIPVRTQANRTTRNIIP